MAKHRYSKAISFLIIFRKLYTKLMILFRQCYSFSLPLTLPFSFALHTFFCRSICRCWRMKCVEMWRKNDKKCMHFTIWFVVWLNQKDHCKTECVNVCTVCARRKLRKARRKERKRHGDREKRINSLRCVLTINSPQTLGGLDLCLMSKIGAKHLEPTVRSMAHTLLWSFYTCRHSVYLNHWQQQTKWKNICVGVRGENPTSWFDVYVTRVSARSEQFKQQRHQQQTIIKYK